jgi:hypothetical protein
VEIGGFDEGLRDYLDEADVCLRLARAGYEIAYLQNNPVRLYPATSPLGPPFIRDRRLIAGSDTNDGLKLRRAACNDFVRHMRDIVGEIRIAAGDPLRPLGRWLRRLADRMRLGLVAARSTRVTVRTPPPFVPFARQPREADADPRAQPRTVYWRAS